MNTKTIILGAGIALGQLMATQTYATEIPNCYQQTIGMQTGAYVLSFSPGSNSVNIQGLLSFLQIVGFRVLSYDYQTRAATVSLPWPELDNAQARQKSIETLQFVAKEPSVQSIRCRGLIQPTNSIQQSF